MSVRVVRLVRWVLLLPPPPTPPSLLLLLVLLAMMWCVRERVCVCVFVCVCLCVFISQLTDWIRYLRVCGVYVYVCTRMCVFDMLLRRIDGSSCTHDHH